MPATPSAVSQFQVLSPFINIRSGPTTTSEVLAQHDEGQIFDAELVEESNWVRPCAAYGGGVRGWAMIDGAELGLGLLLRRLHATAVDTLRVPPAPVQSRAPRPSALTQRLPLLLRAPPVRSEGPLPVGTRGPVTRWRVLRPMILVHVAPSRDAAVCAVAVAGDLVWSCEPTDAELHSSSDSSGGGESSAGLWCRLADPDGWVHAQCPAGFTQLEAQEELHAGHPERELEALDLWAQARIAVLQTFGAAGRMQLADRFRQWEDEALALCKDAVARPEAWTKLVEQRKLAQKSPFAQGLLSVCHRDVVLEAQQQAIRDALQPAQCARQRGPGEIGLSAANVATLRTRHLVVVDGALPARVVQECRAEAETLDARGLLQPPAMHRALGDRRDRLLGIDEGSTQLRRDGALVELIGYLKALGAELVGGGYGAALTVPTSVMLACYDGQGAFYKPHMDSMDSDPRLVTAIFYLVDDAWDGSPHVDGGNLVWWPVDEHATDAVADETAKQEIEPKEGRLVVFNARTVKHEVLPTHRKRFAVTLWFFRGSPE